ncbi:NAD(P)H-dependent oxidoreductase [Methylobacterium isbiliense]|nr:NAD(P)H-dependent oxidoreductase [Methylobacterium isbiliense]MDN3627812.1 NAD(P)H-dependent oxidoreductase [Methylobacterium isbiliense]
MDDLKAEADQLPLEPRRLQVLLVAGSARRLDGCPGLDGKARALMHRMLGRLPAGWQVDQVDIGNEHGKPKIQGCNGCVGSSMALCVWPCNCYGPHSDHQPDLMWNEKLYQRLARADAWAIIGPVWWYGPTTNLKAMFDRLVCMSGGNPRPDLIDIPTRADCDRHCQSGVEIDGECRPLLFKDPHVPASRKTGRARRGRDASDQPRPETGRDLPRSGQRHAAGPPTDYAARC